MHHCHLSIREETRELISLSAKRIGDRNRVASKANVMASVNTAFNGIGFSKYKLALWIT